MKGTADSLDEVEGPRSDREAAPASVGDVEVRRRTPRRVQVAPNPNSRLDTRQPPVVQYRSDPHAFSSSGVFAAEMRDPVRAYLQVLRLAYFRFVSVTWQAMNIFLENGM